VTSNASWKIFNRVLMNGRGLSQTLCSQSLNQRFWKFRESRTRNFGVYSRMKSMMSALKLISSKKILLLKCTTVQVVLHLKSFIRVKRASTWLTVGRACGVMQTILQRTLHIATAMLIKFQTAQDRCSSLM
jgi:hypothetical protein